MSHTDGAPIGADWNLSCRLPIVKIPIAYSDPTGVTRRRRFTAEVIHRRGPWRSFEAVEYATLKWVDWFNHRRLLEPIGSIPPAEAEEQYCAAADQIDMAA